MDAALFMTAAKMSLREISPAGFLFRIGPMPQGQIMWWYRFPFASICSIASRDGRGIWSFITDIKSLYMSLPQLNGEQHKAVHHSGLFKGSVLPVGKKLKLKRFFVGLKLVKGSICDEIWCEIWKLFKPRPGLDIINVFVSIILPEVASILTCHDAPQMSIYSY